MKNNNNNLLKTIDYNILNLDYNVNNDTVLILMPTYNRTDFLIESIESLINQDYPNVLIHIIDDNSDVDVIGIISEFIIENNVHNVILSKKYINTGAYISLNYILKYHINDDFGYWTLHGSDDISDPKRISSLVNFLIRHPEYNSCKSKYIVDVELVTPKYGDTMLLNKKQVFYDIGYYDNNRFGGDSDYSMRVELKYGKIGHVPQTLYYANTGENRLTKKYDKIIRQEYVKKITQEHKQSLYRGFIDVNRDSIVCGLSTIKSRVEGLKETVNSIINQVDKLIVYQNGYYEIFEFLNNPKIEVISSLLTNIDMGDAGKFYKISEYKNCYYFSIDDDLVYPSDYVSNSIKTLIEYNNEIIITYHGRTLKPNATSYYNEPLKFHHCLRNQKNDDYIQFGGTGVMCFHTNKVNISFNYFRYPNMADIWMGKFALENKIPILSLKHDIGWLNDTKFRDNYTIYDTFSKKEDNITEIILEYNKLLSTEKTDTKNISIIIPTYRNTQYLTDCLNSIINSIKDFNCEILVGIDGCELTKEFITNKVFDYRVNFYYFEKNVGPYIIKNSLSKISKSKHILFFDSDDIMLPDMIPNIINDLNKFDCVKPMYINMRNNKLINDGSKNWGEGVFAIKKEIFLIFNGFEPWRCAADSEFMNRLYRNRIKVKMTNDVLFHRRLHNNNLTVKQDTNYHSKLRGKYHSLSMKKTNFGPLQILHVENYTPVIVNHEYSKIIEQQVIEDKITNKEKLEIIRNTVNPITKEIPLEVDIDYEAIHRENKRLILPKVQHVIRQQPKQIQENTKMVGGLVQTNQNIFKNKKR